ncbi:CBS domain-containing protein [Carboxydothermus pertinax]|uniref:CBS domain-containing protein n=1 Tax=Carboxydothermus pertinax TaxID=870242 RepID=A0A1L8CTY6_9THEO|nr:CBS domain-containing protein [Carboxydothermus pertinax]GAV22324.1 hypothetical protein cpu_08340 [Carboxydothermus pertinax]
MDLITTHHNMDFDGLASMVAANLLYPKANLLLPGKALPAVEEFLALYKDRLKIQQKLYNPREIKRLILVDSSELTRFSHLKPYLTEEVEIILYDHHPLAPDLKPYLTEKVVKPCGATVTLLIQRLKELDLKISSVEATVMALGIYQDTGGLLYPSTTKEDIAALLYLFNFGVNLEVVQRFLKRPLSREQELLLKELIKNAVTEEKEGLSYLATWAKTDDYLPGLSYMASYLMELHQPDILVMAVEMDKSVHLVGRSSKEEIDLRSILYGLRVKGHPQAVSGVQKGKKVKEVLDLALKLLRNFKIPAKTVKEVMSWPVKFVTTESTIEEARKIMVRYGHSGLPVLDGDKLVGIISRRDVDKVIHHNLGHAPVKAYMSKNPITINPEASIEEALSLLIKHDIGRLPVVKEGRLLGIVSRTDLLKLFHQPEELKPHKTLYREGGFALNLKKLLEENIPPEGLELINTVGKTASLLGMRAFLVGGIVRDLLLGQKQKDLDFVVEGDALLLVKELGKNLPTLKLISHERFKTASIILKNGQKVDFATSRVEFYQYPAALPEVEASTIKEDLYRRDFTINSMALEITFGHIGELYDPFGGFADLQEGIIRVLHNLSFIEDPTRILRALRFLGRFNFKLEDNTESLLLDAVSSGLLELTSPGRILQEIKLFFAEKDIFKILKLLNHYGVYTEVFPKAHYEEEFLSRYFTFSFEFSRYLKEIKIPWLFGVIGIYAKNLTEISKFRKKYPLTREEEETLIKVTKGIGEALKLLPSPRDIKGHEIYETLKNLPPEGFWALYLLLDRYRAKVRFRQYLEELRFIKPKITGEDLKALGLKPGPLFREILNKIKALKIDGVLKEQKDEILYVRQNYLS